MLLQMGAEMCWQSRAEEARALPGLAERCSASSDGEGPKITNIALFSYDGGVGEMTIIKDPGVGLSNPALSLCNNYSLTTSLHFP